MNFFKSQDIARGNTRKLVILFSLAIISLIIMTNILVMVVFGFLEPERFNSMTAAQAWQESFDWQTFFMIGAGVLVIVISGSIFKIIALSGGGARVAEMMGGELIVDGTGDTNKQKILNVAEEMAIASGTPVPPVYLLDEDGINAFAAGYSPSDAVIGVTRGAIEQLSRDQLQGVVAHEFSHIFNGDMKLNIRLIGVLHGILLLGLIGYYILRGSSRSRSSKNGGGIVFLGMGLVVIGYAGTFFGNLIKAAVSRQREYLADASAVQFTRNPDGIAGALKRIGGNSTGSLIENPNGSEISHALFSQGIKTYFNSMFATHPPLDNRIRKIDPAWDGEFDYTEIIEQPPEESQSSSAQADIKKTTAILTGVAAVLDSEHITNQAGQPSPEHLDYAHNLVSELPVTLKNSVHEPFGARAVIYFLVLDKDKNIRDKQLQHLLASADPDVYGETIKLVNQVNDLKMEYRLPLVDMALPTLRQLSRKQYLLFKENLESLIKIDSKISLFEWSVKKIVLHHLETVFNKEYRKHSKHLSLKQTKDACSVLLSLLIYAGKQRGISEQETFDKAVNELAELDLQLLPKNKLSLDLLNNALDKLARLKPLKKPQLLKACATCITADKQITIAEAELFRAIADTLDCPMPPLII
jgi:Zn-dependent protease with chaperone function